MSSRLERNSMTGMEGKTMKWECMRSKAVYALACVQIAIGVLLFFGSVHMAFSVMPKVSDRVSQMGKTFADAAEAVRENNKTYNELATIVFSLSGILGDAASDVGVLGGEVTSLGRSLHFDIPVLDKINTTGYSVRNIGNYIVRFAAKFKEGVGAVDAFRYNVHPQNSRSVNDAAEALEEVSKLMLNGSKVEAYGGWICLLGVLLSLLFVMNGLVLFAVENKRLVGAAFVQR